MLEVNISSGDINIMSIRILIVAGTIGSGKSAVCKILSKHIKVISLDELARQAHNDKYVINSVEQYFGSQCVINGVIDRSKLSQAAFENKANLDKLNEIMHPFILRLLNEQLQQLALQTLIKNTSDSNINEQLIISQINPLNIDNNSIFYINKSPQQVSSIGTSSLNNNIIFNLNETTKLNQTSNVIAIEVPLYHTQLADIASVIWYVTCDPQLQFSRAVNRGVNPEIFNKIIKYQADTSKWLDIADEIIVNNNDLDNLNTTVNQLLGKYNLS